MPHTNTWDRGVVIKRFWGFLSGDELARSAEEIAADQGFDDLRFIVNDFREVDGHSIDAEAMERIAVTRFGSMATNPAIRVVVVSSDPALAALADLANSPVLLGSQETVAFENMGLAREWMIAQASAISPRGQRS